ncbi:Solute carrier family 25 member 44 [Sesamum angolense]|uniref:Solute carrier family 25 member 44 n=1 Tax=Sesamum angolense TaxID=2727404 RepID=A0AAE1W7W5_9LAMI|nr:Solute carrier family 25 member 44 [Sesamum angolense]
MMHFYCWNLLHASSLYSYQQKTFPSYSAALNCAPLTPTEAAMAIEAADAATPELALADTEINWDRLDKTRFHVIGAILFTAQSALIHPTAVVKTRMQVAGSGLSQMTGLSVFRHIIRRDGVPGIFRGFGTSAIGSLPGRVLALTSLEVSKDMTLKYTEGLNVPEATRIGIANGVAGMVSNLVSCVYFVPLDVICQRLMVQGLPGTTSCNGPFDVVSKVTKAEGFRGMYRGFGLTAITQSPASALWWGAYGAAQHIIWRSVGYRDDLERKPSHVEMVAVQATAGMVAGACSSVITTPIDTVKTRLQVIDNYGVGRPSVLKTAKTLLKEDGWRGFYRGFGPRFLNMSFYGTTMIVTYELINACACILNVSNHSRPERLSVKQA